MSDDLDPGIAGLPPPRETRDLVGHERVRRTIEALHRTRRLHHAMLLIGPRGVGKATLGYAVAGMILSGEPGIGSATTSDARAQIAGGAAQGFRRLTVGTTREGKPKREIGVEEVRALQPYLRQRLGGEAWRVVLVDSADALNASSANAMLKVLEEPGARTLFILVAHGERPLLPTIRSRCIRYGMDGLSDGDMRAVLARSELTAEQAEAVIPLANGSVRRAIALATTGAGDALDAARRVIEAVEWNPSAAARVTEAAVGRGADATFAEIGPGLVGMLRDHASAIARVGHIERAACTAEAAGRIERELGEREAYGIDRAQSLRAALQLAHGAVEGRLAKGEGSG